MLTKGTSGWSASRRNSLVLCIALMRQKWLSWIGIGGPNVFMAACASAADGRSASCFSNIHSKILSTSVTHLRSRRMAWNFAAPSSRSSLVSYTTHGRRNLSNREPSIWTLANRCGNAPSKRNWYKTMPAKYTSSFEEHTALCRRGLPTPLAFLDLSHSSAAFMRMLSTGPQAFSKPVIRNCSRPFTVSTNKLSRRMPPCAQPSCSKISRPPINCSNNLIFSSMSEPYSNKPRLMSFFLKVPSASL
mmetsp:Transcript_10445/g.29804  ORF Transcript_10445/g.29804 Transcript_10445/m.29804 type:complete len:246 (-) Transcript_10445:696-1433(-)